MPDITAPTPSEAAHGPHSPRTAYLGPYTAPRFFVDADIDDAADWAEALKSGPGRIWAIPIDTEVEFIEPSCDCPLDPHHRWNCSLTPIWAQTIRDLDTNPWTVITSAVRVIPQIEHWRRLREARSAALDLFIALAIDHATRAISTLCGIDTPEDALGAVDRARRRAETAQHRAHPLALAGADHEYAYYREDHP